MACSPFSFTIEVGERTDQSNSLTRERNRQEEKTHLVSETSDRRRYVVSIDQHPEVVIRRETVVLQERKLFVPTFPRAQVLLKRPPQVLDLVRDLRQEVLVDSGFEFGPFPPRRSTTSSSSSSASFSWFRARTPTATRASTSPWTGRSRPRTRAGPSSSSFSSSSVIVSVSSDEVARSQKLFGIVR